MDRDKQADQGARVRDALVASLAATMVVACILWNLDAPIRLGVAVLSPQYMAFELGLALVLAFARFGWRAETSQGSVLSTG